MSLQMDSGEPLVRQIGRALQRAIVTTRLLPGQVLSVAEIAATFQISRQPVTEAFLLLRDSRLVEMAPHRPIQVTRIAVADVELASFIRCVLECAVVREAAQRATPEQVTDLHLLVDTYGEDLPRNDRAHSLAQDDAFHRRLSEIAGRLAIWGTLDKVMPAIDRVRFLAVQTDPKNNKNINEHRVIVDAIGRGDGAAAAELMQRHQLTVLGVARELRQSRPELFADP